MTNIYPIKSLFQKARDADEIMLVLPEFITTLFHVISVPIPQEDKEEYVLTKSHDEKEWCLTISPNESLVKLPNYAVVSLRGRELLKSIHQNAGVLIIYEDGGDYLTTEHVNLFKQIID